MAAEPLCDIVVPIWNQRERTQRCLESVLAHTGLPVRLILIDNGSDPPARGWLQEFAARSAVPIQLIQNSENLGFIKAVNQGIRASRSPWICLLNNDTIVAPRWLPEMIQVAESDPTIGLVNPTSNSLGYPSQGRSPEEIGRRLAGQRGQSAPLSTALGFCLLARRAIFDRIGLLDEQFGMGNFDDNDLTLRVRQAGLRPVRALAAYVYHEEKVSFKKLTGWKKDFEKNRIRFEQKWGRPLRILWGPAVPAVLSLETLAGAGHWVCVVGPRNAGPGPRVEHAQVDYPAYPDRCWRSRATWRLITKRKKPFDLVVSHDPAWSRWIHRLQIFHRARLLNNPTESELLEQCRKLSRSPSGPR